MQTASGLPIRKRIRLRDFAYDGVHTYYVTINAYEKRCLFGTCDGESVTLNALGRLVQSAWLDTPRLRPEVILDELIVMPNHMHAILCITSEAEPAQSARLKKLYRILGGFKGHVTGEWRKHLADPTFEVWQIRFHDHVVRATEDLERIRAYIRGNPMRWRREYAVPRPRGFGTA
jgi:REP element-mobilizing transposase RayT